MYSQKSEIMSDSKGWVIFAIVACVITFCMPCLADANQIKHIPYKALIVKAAKKYKVSPALITAVIKVESSFKSQARNNRSSATGLMQLTKGTARDLGLVVSKKRDDRLSPEKNIMAGTRYLKQQLDLFDGNIKLALSAYHAGPITALLWSGVPPISRDYVNKVLKFMKRYEIVFLTKKNR